MNPKNKSMALITGCNGEIGISICKELLKKGFLVIGTDKDKIAKLDLISYISCELIDFVENEPTRLKFNNFVN